MAEVGDYTLAENSPCLISGEDGVNMGALGIGCSVLGVSTLSIPEKFDLYQNYPNPFNPTTKIKYDLPQDNMVTITIYDIMGRNVRTIVNTKQTAGYHSLQWDAKNNIGSKAAAGVYIYTIQAGEFNASKKMVLLK